MSIISLIKELDSKKTYKTGRDRAVEQFTRQRDAILAIAGTPGFEEILNFLDRQIGLHEQRLDTCHDERAWDRVAGARDEDKALRTFLKNLTKKITLPEEEA